MKIQFDTKEEIKRQSTHIKKTYCGKAKIFLFFSLAILIFSMLTYLIPLALDIFDFGIFFELIALVFTILALIACSKENVKSAKKYIIIAAISIGWLVIYDFIFLLPFILENFFSSKIRRTFNWLDMYFFLELLNFSFYFNAFRALRKAGGKVTQEEAKDWFYDVE